MTPIDMQKLLKYVLQMGKKKLLHQYIVCQNIMAPVDMQWRFRKSDTYEKRKSALQYITSSLIFLVKRNQIFDSHFISFTLFPSVSIYAIFLSFIFSLVCVHIWHKCQILIIYWCLLLLWQYALMYTTYALW